MKKFSIIILLVLVCFAYIFINKGDKVTNIHTDTIRVVHVDTVQFYKPIPKDSFIIRYITERISIYDTIDVEEHVYVKDLPNDSLSISIPITSKVYKDSLYTAYISGYNANLDSINIINTTKILKATNAKKWSVGIGGGIGVNAEPYIGVSVHYKLVEF